MNAGHLNMEASVLQYRLQIIVRTDLRTWVGGRKSVNMFFFQGYKLSSNDGVKHADKE